MSLELEGFQFHLAPGLLLHNCTVLSCRLRVWGMPVGARELRRQHLESCAPTSACCSTHWLCELASYLTYLCFRLPASLERASFLSQGSCQDEMSKCLGSSEPTGECSASTLLLFKRKPGRLEVPCLLSPCLGRAASFMGQSLWKPWEQMMRSLGSVPSTQTWLACGGKAREKAARESLPGCTQLCWAHRLSRTWPLAYAG